MDFIEKQVSLGLAFDWKLINKDTLKQYVKKGPVILGHNTQKQFFYQFKIANAYIELRKFPTNKSSFRSKCALNVQMCMSNILFHFQYFNIQFV